MKNFIISAGIDIVIIFVSYYIFRSIISGPTRHKMYEKFMSSFAKFIIYIFIATVAITATTSFIIYRTRYIPYLNIIASMLVSVLVGFIMSTVPTRGYGDQQNK